MNEIGPRFVLTPVKIFEGSFGGAVVWENKGGCKCRRYSCQPLTASICRLDHAASQAAERENGQGRRIQKPKGSRIRKERQEGILGDSGIGRSGSQWPSSSRQAQSICMNRLVFRVVVLISEYKTSSIDRPRLLHYLFASINMASVVLPGDSVRTLPSTTQARLGPGVQQVLQPKDGQKQEASKTHVAAVRAGLLGITASKEGSDSAAESIWIESRMKRVSSGIAHS